MWRGGLFSSCATEGMKPGQGQPLYAKGREGDEAGEESAALAVWSFTLGCVPVSERVFSLLLSVSSLFFSLPSGCGWGIGGWRGVSAGGTPVR